MYEIIKQRVDEAQKIVIIQPENPDGDSLGTAIALEHILSDLGKEVTMFCAIDMPKYLRYIDGWDRVSGDWTGKYDLGIIVDTCAEALLVKAVETPGFRHFAETHPVLVLDHHNEGGEEGDADSLTFPHELVMDESAAATSELVLDIAATFNWPVSAEAASALFASLQADTLGLTTHAVGARQYETATKLVQLGANPSHLEEKRREFMKKPADILAYKGELIGRVEYYLDGKLATVHIPWEDIEKYSDKYNPSVLVLDEMRLVEGVEVAVAIKTYPDGKLTGKIRSNTPVADQVAGYFGGGGHSYAAGFKIYEHYDTTLHELVKACDTITRKA